jgi:GNAT superfamily N-acetyltransferase
MCSPATSWSIRLATVGDAPLLEELIDQSVRKLQAPTYSDKQIEMALALVFGVDTQLIRDRTYYVAAAGNVIVGCGGWSRRKTLFGGDQAASRDDEFLDPASDAAKVRAMFVHPDWVRRGIGRAILGECEAAAAAAGFRTVELASTLAGVPLYEATGYVAVEPIAVPLADGESLPVIRMRKRLQK